MPLLSRCVPLTTICLVENQLQGKKVVICAYSAGAMLSMKLWARLSDNWHRSSFSVFIGTLKLFSSRERSSSTHVCVSCGSRAGASFTPGKNVDMVMWYWSAETMEKLGKLKMFEALHGDNYPSTIAVIKQWSARTSSIFLTEAERRKIISSGRVYWISGSLDQPYPPTEITDWIEDKPALSRCLQVPCDHFNYFSTGWEYTSAALKLVCGREANLPPSVPLPSKL